MGNVFVDNEEEQHDGPSKVLGAMKDMNTMMELLNSTT